MPSVCAIPNPFPNQTVDNADDAEYDDNDDNDDVSCLNPTPTNVIMSSSIESNHG